MRCPTSCIHAVVTPTLSAIAPALPSHMDVVNVENAGAFFHLLTYIHVGIQQERELF
jgi:hypothetical protein